MNGITVGHITRDRYPEGFVPGGSVWYIGHTWSRMLWDIQALVMTAGNPLDMPFARLPAAVQVQEAEVTTTFHNTYAPEGRTMRIEALAPPIEPVAPPGPARRWSRVDMLLLAPVAGEVDPVAWTAQIDARLKAAGLQGWLKKLVDGRFVPRPAAFDLSTLRGLDVVFLSDEDYGGDGPWLKALRAVVPRVYLTHGAEGCTVFDGPHETHVPARAVEEVDPTGAGDTFAAATLAALAEGLDPVKAAGVGAAMAAKCVGVRGPVR